MGTENKPQKATLYYMNVGTSENPEWVPIGLIGNVTIGCKPTIWKRIKTALVKIKSLHSPWL